MAVHIATVGVSLLANAVRRGLARSVEELVASVEQDPSMRSRILDLLRADPWGMTAELNAMRPYLEEGSVEEVFLIGTWTPAGGIAVDLLIQFMGERAVPAAGTIVPLKDEGEEERFAASLEGLWEILVGSIRRFRAEGRDVAINATGGLKPELAVCLIAGNLAGVPVYYRHERFDRTVVLPTLVWPLCPSPIREALALLAPRHLGTPEAERFYAEHDGARLEELRLILVDRASDGGIRGVRLAPYGRLLLDLARTGADPGLGEP